MEKKELFYVGGYSDSISLCAYKAGGIEVLGSYGIRNASYLCLSPDRKYLYAVVEAGSYKGQAGGGVAAFEVQGGGTLRFINDSSTGGAGPCYVSVSADGQSLYAANYSGGSSAFFNIGRGGEIGEMKRLLQHSDFGQASHAAPGRQDKAYAHFITPKYINGVQTLWLCDLGLDCVLVLDSEGCEIARYRTPPGYGPRHISFHPKLPRAYVACEMGNAALTLEYGFSGGALNLSAASKEISTLPEPDAESTCAAIRVSPGNKRLLVSNRGKRTDSVSVLGLDAEGNTTRLEHIVSADGNCPRDFVFNPAGDNVLIANQDSSNVCVFSWDEETGALISTGVRLPYQKPTCVLFIY